MVDSQPQQDIEVFRRELKLLCSENVKQLYKSSQSILEINKSKIYTIELVSNFLLIIGILPFILILYLMFRLSSPFIIMLPLILIILAIGLFYDYIIGTLKIYLVVVSAHEHKIIISMKELFDYWSEFLKKNIKDYFRLNMLISSRILLNFSIGFIPSFILLTIIFNFIFGISFLYSYFIPNVTDDATNRVYDLIKILSIVLPFIVGLIRVSYLSHISTFTSLAFIENKLSGYQDTAGEIVKRNDKLFDIAGDELLVSYNLRKAMSMLNILDIQDIAYFYCFYKFISEELKIRKLI